MDGVNDTMVKFGWRENELARFNHWVVLMRPQQVTLGSLVLVAKGEAEAFGDLDPAAHAELATITKTIEKALKAAVAYDRLNYLMLMMVDPHVHFHVIPRYTTDRLCDGTPYPDSGWPGPPDLKSTVAGSNQTLHLLRQAFDKLF